MFLSALVFAACSPLSAANSVLRVPNQESSEMGVKKVAIIGAGAGGASTAYYIRKYATEASVQINITVFDRNSYIGGRSTTVDAWGSVDQPVELGASIFVKVNKVLMDAVQEFNLSTKETRDARPKVDGPMLGIWNGQEFVLTQNSDSWWDTAKLLWRYGLAPIRTHNLMKEVVGKFLKMYDEPVFPWRSLSQVAYDLGLTAVTAATGEEYLNEHDIGSLFAQEVVQASTRVNYAQNLPFIHGLEGMVSMATDGAVSVDGGNWRIFDKMTRSATSDIRLRTTVTAVERQSDNTYAVRFKQISSGVSPTPAKEEYEHFDSVVLTAPLQFSRISIDPAPTYTPDQIPYVLLFVTLFASPHRLSPAAFNLPDGTTVPEMILTTLQPGEKPGEGKDGVGRAGFFSISVLRGAINPGTSKLEYIYKIFSPRPVNSTFLAKILGIEAPPAEDQEFNKDDISWMKRKGWHSYPYLPPRDTFDELQLDKNLWYTSGIESFISTMETSGLMGKNIAKLVVNGWIQAEEANGKITDSTAAIKPSEFEPMQKPLKAKL